MNIGEGGRGGDVLGGVAELEFAGIRAELGAVAETFAAGKQLTLLAGDLDGEGFHRAEVLAALPARPKDCVELQGENVGEMWGTEGLALALGAGRRLRLECVSHHHDYDSVRF